MSAGTDKEIVCDFHSLWGSDAAKFPLAGEALFDEGIKTIDRNLTVKDGVVRIAQWTEQGDCYCAALLRLKHGEVQIANLSTDELRTVPVAEDEGIAAVSCFSYWPEYGVLVTERNLKAGGASLIVACCTRSRAPYQKIYTAPMFDETGHRKLRRARDIASVEVAISNPMLMSLEDQRGASVGEMIAQLASGMSGGFVTIKVSVGHVKGRMGKGLDRTGVETFINESGRFPGTTERISVKGHFDDSLKEELVNLIEDRLVVVETAPERATYQDTWDALARAYGRVRPVIAQQRGRPQKPDSGGPDDPR